MVIRTKGNRLLWLGLVTIGLARTLSVLFYSKEGFGDVSRIYVGKVDPISNPAGLHLMKDRKKAREKKRSKKTEQSHNKRQSNSKALIPTVPKFKPQHKPRKRPALDSLISDRIDGIKGDVRWLLDFAILGFAKSATSYLMKTLNAHPEVQIWDHEVCDLYDLKPAELTRKLYEELPEGNYQRGFKCPGHFSRRSMRYFRQYFSKTNLIVGLRHPVRWFESFYNFRIRHGGHGKSGDALPPPEKLIGECTEEAQGVCTDQANFHINLANLGKTNVTNPSEKRLFRVPNLKFWRIVPIENPVFLYDVAQLYDTNKTRTALFQKDLQNFLGLKAPMPVIENEPSKSTSKLKVMDICDPKYDDIRKELIAIGTRASMWIRKYFLKSDQVYVSSRDFFEKALKDWKNDPCALRRNVTDH